VILLHLVILVIFSDFGVFLGVFGGFGPGLEGPK
jgi:hypothetical protein